MISLWFAFFFAHICGLTIDAWWCFPFTVTAVLSAALEAFFYLAVLDV